MIMTSVKEELYQACADYVRKKEESILKTIQSYQEALNSETKSSAGDKHETGRAMLQLEMEKASQQLEVIHSMKAVLQRIDSSKNSAIVALGSIVITDSGNYFLSISAGGLKVKNEIYYAVSNGSPIGKLLLGKKAGETVNFKRQLKIKEVI